MKLVKSTAAFPSIFSFFKAVNPHNNLNSLQSFMVKSSQVLVTNMEMMKYG